MPQKKEYKFASNCNKRQHTYYNQCKILLGNNKPWIDNADNSKKEPMSMSRQKVIHTSDSNKSRNSNSIK